jgi:hypothetical protein|nr:hypothetical protein [Enterobacter cloacae]
MLGCPAGLRNDAARGVPDNRKIQVTAEIKNLSQLICSEAYRYA